MENITVDSLSIKALWLMCEDRKFAVPEIQREFVWDKRRISDLLDSIYKKLPIGCLLIWKAHGDQRQLLRHTQVLLPPHDPANRDTLFLIDGQQRLSALFRSFVGGVVTNTNGRVIDFDQLCFDLSSDEANSNFLFTRRPVLEEQIYIKDILSDSWQRRCRRLAKWKRRCIKECRQAILSYKVPVIWVHTHELGEVREAFLRINSGGLRISEADRAFSRASRLDLRRLVRELKEGLPKKFNEMDARIIQVAMAVILGQKDTSSKSVNTAIARLEKTSFSDGGASRKFVRIWKEISNCIRKAVDYFLNDLSVLNFSFLPSDLMIAVLAYFFYTNNRAQPNRQQAREIKKWFWATGVGRRYVGRGYYNHIRDDLNFFKRLGYLRKGHFIFKDLVHFGDLLRTDYTSGGSLVTTFFLLLVNREPRYLENGVTMPLEETAAMANRKDKHHIFPKELLKRNGYSSREANSLANICYIVAEENQSIGSTKPAVYLDIFKRSKHFAGVMKSHLIPYKSDCGVWRTAIRPAYRQFLKERTELIRQALEKEAGIRLFRRD